MLLFLICLIFIIYITFIGLSIYYFIKHRNIWESIFNLDSIMEIFACPEHLIIPIPGIILENTKCIIERNKKFERKEKIFELLKNIQKNLDIISGDDKIFISEFKCLKWILKGSINDYEIIYEQSQDIFYKLLESHQILNSNDNNINNKINIDDLQIEHYIIENNLEICEKLIESVKIFILDVMKDLQSQYTFALLLKIYYLLQNYKFIYKMFIDKFI
jgi:hypothetical protein